jgi:hypothetical protein
MHRTTVAASFLSYSGRWVKFRGFLLTQSVVHGFMGAVGRLLSFANSDEVSTEAMARDGTF